MDVPVCVEYFISLVTLKLLYDVNNECTSVPQRPCCTQENTNYCAFGYNRVHVFNNHISIWYLIQCQSIVTRAGLVVWFKPDHFQQKLEILFLKILC